MTPNSRTRATGQTILTIALSLTLTLVIIAAAGASPPSPELLEQLKASGQLDKFVERMSDARAQGFFAPLAVDGSVRDPQSKATLFNPDVVDTFRVLVILADFDDNPASGGTVYGMPADFEELLFSNDSLDGVYSMTEFYYENSYGGFLIQGDVAGWYRMPETYAYYVNGNYGFGTYPQSAAGMAYHSFLAADPDVDYSNYDNDGDGWIDGVFIVHAGPGAEQTGSVDHIWSHASAIPFTLTLDGANMRSYTTEPEENTSSGLVTFGVYAHEYGHFLGLPDLYDTDYSSSGIGRWSLMAGGSWNNNGSRPAFFDAWCKSQLGWMNVFNINPGQIDVELPSSYHNPVAYRVWQNGQVGPQYFLAENRRSVGHDNYIPGSGLLIMQIDETIGGNSNENHPKVAIEQADGLFELEAGTSSGDAWDVWSTATKTDFDDLSTPNTRMYTGVKTETAVWNISASDSVMDANFDISYSRPRFFIWSGEFSDSAFGNDNGIAEDGESITFTFVLENLWLGATNVTGAMTSDNNDIVFDVPSVNIGAVPGEGGNGDNFADPIVFTIPVGFVPCIDSFYLELSSDNPYGGETFGFELHIGAPEILVVDDDNGASWESAITSQLYARRIPFNLHDKSVSGSPTGSQLSAYATVMWLTGNDRADILSADDVSAMQTFLDNGGNLFLNGQTIVHELDTDDQAFLNNYLHAAFDSDLLYPLMFGVDDSPIGDGIKIRYNTTTNQTNPQVMYPTGGALAEFIIPSGEATAVSYEGAYKVVLFSFGFEAIANQFATYATQATVFGRILDFFSVDTASINPAVANIGAADEASQNVINHFPTFYWSVTDSTANPITMHEVAVGTGSLCYNNDNMWSPAQIAGDDTSIVYAGDWLEDGEQYVFRVRVFNGVTWSNWHEFPFRMNATATPGFAIQPTDDELVATATPTLNRSNSVDPDGDPLTYDFEVYSDSAMTNLAASVLELPEGDPTTTWTVDVPLDEDARYWWRSRTHDGYEYGEYIEAASFWVNAVNQAPNSFSLAAPPDKDTVLWTYPVLSWRPAIDNDPADVVRYRLQVSTDSLFGSYDEVEAYYDTSATMPIPAELNSQYFWRVRAVDLAQAVTWSTETFTFYTEYVTCCIARGNIDHDPTGQIDIGDLVYLVDFMFSGGPAPACFDEGDVDASDAEPIDIADLVYLVDYMFTSGPGPAPCF